MALDTIIGGATSDSYVTAVEMVAYATALGWGIGTGPESDHDPHLRRAAQYLDRTYDFAGSAVSKNQALAWPRDTDVLGGNGFEILTTEIPEGIRRAQMELAWIVHQGGDLLATVDNGVIQSSRVKAGSVESETSYFDGTGRDTPRYPQIDGLIAPYITGGGATIKMRRG